MSIFLIFPYLIKCQNKVQIYHGEGDESQFLIYQTNSDKINLLNENSVIKCKSGDYITFEVINPNPLLYEYIITSQKINAEQVSEQYKEIFEYYNILTQVFGGVSFQKTANARTIRINSMVKITNVGPLRDRGDTINVNLANYLLSFQEENLSFINEQIKQSDVPIPLKNLLDDPKKGEMRVFLQNMETHIDGFLNAFERDIKPLLDEGEIYFHEFPNENAYVFEILKDQALNLQSEVQEYKTLYSSKKIKFNIKFKEKIESKTVFHFSVSALNEQYNRRDIKDSMLSITVVPVYSRPEFEVVPLVSAAFANDNSEFHLQDGVIKQSKTGKPNYETGLTVIWNMYKFGELKESSVGFNAGVQISPKREDLFNLNTGIILSFKDIFRIGFGIGTSQYPTGINGANLGQALPADIENIEDIILYDTKFAYFINFSVFGLSFTK